MHIVDNTGKVCNISKLYFYVLCKYKLIHKHCIFYDKVFSTLSVCGDWSNKSIYFEIDQ